MSTYYNKSNYNVKEYPEQNLIEMSTFNKEVFCPCFRKINTTLSELLSEKQKYNFRKTDGKFQGQK